MVAPVSVPLVETVPFGFHGEGQGLFLTYLGETSDHPTVLLDHFSGYGVARGSMDMTIDYLKQRKQFGKLIGEFQALQHRAAHLYSEVEIARAVTIKAQQLLDAGAENASLMASVAKAKVDKAAGLAVKEGVQMHGGIGMTDEYDIGLYMKRDRALAEFMGDVYYHADRVARMSGY